MSLTKLVWAQSYDGVKTVLQDSEEIDQVDTKGFGPLHYSAFLNNPQITKLLFEHGQSVDLMDSRGNTALHWSAQEGALEMMELLLGTGADLNSQNHQGETPLYLAVSASQSACTRFLLERNADLNLPDLGGVHPIHIAVISGQEMMKILLSFQPKVNVRDEYGDTPLHWAVREGKKDMIELLVTAGADCHLQNEDGETAASLASVCGEKEILSLFAPLPQQQEGEKQEEHGRPAEDKADELNSEEKEKKTSNLKRKLEEHEDPETKFSKIVTS